MLFHVRASPLPCSWSSRWLPDLRHDDCLRRRTRDDTRFQDPTVHVFSARTGEVVFQDSGSASFGPTTVAHGLTFNCPALNAVLNVRTATTGTKVARVELPAPCWSGSY